MTAQTDTVYPGWDLEQSPFHVGEQAIQSRVGVRDKIEAQGRRAVRRFLTGQHRDYFPQLPYVFVGSVDADGRPWASMLLGEPGFLSTPNDKAMHVRAAPMFGDPLGENLREGAEVALLGVQFHTRRRNRAMGSIADVTAAGFTLNVRQATGVCPQYIQGRELAFTDDPSTPQPRPVHRADRLDDRARSIIERADTYFIASANAREADGEARGADISHRGGRTGFVRVDDERTLTAPDFVGNFMFNTLGNWQFDNRAGLLFIDFEHGDMLYIATRANVIWEGPEVRAFAGAQRLYRYTIDAVIRVENSLPGRFTAPEFSPVIERTGSWDRVAQTLAADRQRNTWRPFTIVAVGDEGKLIKSFYLEPADGGGVASFQPGQHLPIKVKPEGWADAVTRTYTLSDTPNGRSYRISVKREGRGGISDWLHDHAARGTIEALAPRGAFVFDEGAGRSVVLISGGVGITPMIAMLNSQLVGLGRTRLHRPIHFLHATSNSQHQSFAAHLRQKAELHSNLALRFIFSAPASDDQIGRTHHAEGRIDRAFLQQALPLDDYDVYLCGPPGFMQTVYDALLSLGVRDQRIHAESFGPSSLKRRRAVSFSNSDDSGGVRVEFAKSQRTALWRPSVGSLLELAEANGISALHSCRTGRCGTCATRVLAGDVDYAEPPDHEIEPGQALICCATPRPGPHIDEGSPNREGITLDL